MKKLLFIAIILFVGIISASAQAYTVYTSWTPTNNWPNNMDYYTDGYGVWITIYDVTNNVEVVKNASSDFLDNTTENYIFDGDVAATMESYISGLSGAAEFKIYCAVRAGNSVSLVVYDYGNSTTTGYTSDDFISGQVSAAQVFL